MQTSWENSGELHVACAGPSPQSKPLPSTCCRLRQHQKSTISAQQFLSGNFFNSAAKVLDTRQKILPQSWIARAQLENHLGLVTFAFCRSTKFKKRSRLPGAASPAALKLVAVPRLLYESFAVLESCRLG